MIEYLFDTSVFSYVFTRDPLAEPYRRYLVDTNEFYLSFASEAELWYGALRDGWGEFRKNTLRSAIGLYTVLPVGPSTPYLYGRILAKTESEGVSLSSNDAWIAATAIGYGLPLVTHDKDFLRVNIEGLKVIHHPI